MNSSVYWTYGSAITSSSGAYSITVWADQPVTLIASHSLYAWRSLVLQDPQAAASTPQDFTLPYLLTTTVTPEAFNTVPQALTFSIYSTVPQVGSKALIQLASGATIQLPFDTSYVNPSGWSRWRGNWTVPAGTAQGRVTFHACVLDGLASGTCNPPSTGLLSQVKSEAYAFDTTAPSIGLASLTPLDHGNTMFASQPFAAKIVDAGGAGLSAAGISFTVSDETAGTSTTVPADSYNATTGWASSGSSSLTIGHVYRLTVSATDLAGNVSTISHSPASQGGGFLVTSIQLSPALASIAPTPCSISESIDASGSKTVTCSDVPLHLAPSQVVIAGTRHAGIGYVEQRVELSTAQVKTTLGGSPQSQVAYQTSDPAWAPRTLSTQVVAPLASTSSQTIRISEVDARIGTLTTKVPASWNAATLEMTPTASQPSIAACANPVGASVACVPDPLRFFLGDRVGQTFVDDERNRIVRTSSTMLVDQFLADTIRVDYLAVYNSATGHWDLLAPQGGCVEGSCLTPLSYTGGYPAISPEAYESVCAQGLVHCYAPETPIVHQVGQPIDPEKQNVLVSTTRVDYGPGVFPGQEDPPRDWWGFSGIAEILGATTRTDYSNFAGSRCDHVLRDFQPPFTCYGFADNAESFDGFATAWPGAWSLLTDSALPAPQAEVKQFADQAQCFDYSSTKEGLASEITRVTWSHANVRIEGDLPQDWDGSGGGLTNLDAATQSGAMKSRQSGSFSHNAVDCRWATYSYAVGGSVYQNSNGESADPGTVTTSYVHAWTSRTWSWALDCTDAVSCLWSPNPGNDAESAARSGTSVPYQF